MGGDVRLVHDTGPLGVHHVVRGVGDVFWGGGSGCWGGGECLVQVKALVD